MIDNQNVDDILLENSRSLNDLFIGTGLDAEDNANEPTLFQNSPYYSNSQFIELLADQLNKFTILSLNCQSLNAKFELLKSYIEMYNTEFSNLSAVCLQETWLSAGSDTSLLQIENYNLIYKGKSCSAHGGVAIYLHDSFQYEIVDFGNNSEIWDGLIIKISTNYSTNCNKILTLGNIYRPPRQNVTNISTFINELNDLFHFLKNQKNVIITGDFNLDLLKFKQCNAINDFLEFMISCNYLPKIMLPTRLSNRTGTLIDNNFAKLTDQCNTTSGVILCQISDHLPYFTTLDYFHVSAPPLKHIKVVSSDTKSYSDFKNDLNSESIKQKLRNIQSDNPNTTYSNFNDIMQSLLDKHFPNKLVKYNKYKHKRSPWITRGILKSIRYKDKLYVKLKSITTDNEQYESRLINYKTYSKILRQMINAAKNNYYHNCFDKYKSDIKNTWSTINGILKKGNKNKQFPKQFEINGLSISNEKSIADEFNKYFINIGPNLTQNTDYPPNSSFKDYLTSPLANNFEFKTVTPNSIVNIINSLKPKTSCNFDRISSKLLKNIKHEISFTLANIFNQCIKQSIFPELLKKTKVIPVYKDKEDFLFNNYRPISILSSLSKVFERVLYNQMFEYLSQLKVFHKSQYGFRKFHSTELATLELVDRITYAMDQNLLPINIYLDLSKAFDTLDHQILLHKLKYYGINCKAIELLESYLNNRSQQVQYNETISQSLMIKCGVPQGSILGPLMFIVYINDMTEASKYFYPLMYADDTTLCATLNSNYENTDKDRLNCELNEINMWLKLNKLTLNINKTKGMAFHTPQRHVSVPELFIDNKKIEFVENFNFLGIIINKNLKWNNHIDMIAKKIAKTVGIMKKLKNTLPSWVLKNIYNALILSYLNYGVIIWGGKNNSRLFKLQKKAVRAIAKSKYNAHTSPLFRNFGLLTIDDLCALHDMKFCYKFGNDLLPDYFSTNLFFRFPHNSLHSTRQQFIIRLPAVSHDFAKYTISYKFPKTFNNIDKSIKEKIDTHSFDGFKKYVKNKMLAAYNLECNIANCYICQN